MSTYVIGDIQGCFDDLLKLLEEIQFNNKTDTLIFCGDLVNRGGSSLEVLRWVYANQNCCRVILGNHDLSLLAQYYEPKFRKLKNIEFQQIFSASDCNLLMNWLINQQILVYLKKFKTIVVHAGIHPLWNKKRAIKEAKNIQYLLSSNPKKTLSKMFGSKPNHWHDTLNGIDRTRFAINSFTRMRFLYKNGGLNFKAKGKIDNFPQLIPWYEYPSREKLKDTIVFGHWSALGLFSKNGVICIDTGKVWGGKLTALKLDNLDKKGQHVFQV